MLWVEMNFWRMLVNPPHKGSNMLANSIQSSAGRGDMGMYKKVEEESEGHFRQRAFSKTQRKEVERFSRISVWWELMRASGEGRIWMAKKEDCFERRGQFIKVWGPFSWDKQAAIVGFWVGTTVLFTFVFQEGGSGCVQSREKERGKTGHKETQEGVPHTFWWLWAQRLISPQCIAPRSSQRLGKGLLPLR